MFRNRAPTGIPFFLFCSLILSVAVQARPPVYRIVEVGRPDGSLTVPLSVSDTGYVCGDDAIPEPSPPAHIAFRAFVWHDGIFHDLGTLGGQRSSATSVNSLGQVVGWAEDVGGKRHAVLWLMEPAYGMPAGMYEFGLVGPWTQATQITEDGRIVIDHLFGQPYVWLPFAFRDFPAGLSPLHEFGPPECRQGNTVPRWNDRGELAGDCLWLPEDAYGLEAGWHLMPEGTCSQYCESMELPQFWGFSNGGVVLVAWYSWGLLEGPNLLSALDLKTGESWSVDWAQWLPPWAVNDTGVMVGGGQVATRVAGRTERYELRARVLTRNDLYFDAGGAINNEGWIAARCGRRRTSERPGCLLIPVDLNFNGDSTTDIQDYLSLAGCFNGAGAEPTGECARFDVDRNGRVDLGDFQALQLAFGP